MYGTYVYAHLTHTHSYSYLLDVMIEHGRAALFVGPTGTGKTVYVKDKLLNGLNKEVFQPLVSGDVIYLMM